MTQSSKRPTLADVAALAKTSTAVVSYVVNNGPRKVSVATRARVEAAIAELGYRRDPLARALSEGRSNFVGVLIPDNMNGFFAELLASIENEARTRSILLVVGNTGYDPHWAQIYSQAFADLRPLGILEVPIAHSAPYDDMTKRVFVHATPSQSMPPEQCILLNNHGAATMLVNHLVADGYRDIHCFNDVSNEGPSKLREQGWRDALVSHGLDPAGRLHDVPFGRVSAEKRIREIFLNHPLPAAVLAATDEQALATIRAARALGIRIPQDLSVVGIDGIAEALQGSISLTTVRFPLDLFARRALDLLTNSSDNRQTHAEIQGELVLGETCKCSISKEQ